MAVAGYQVELVAAGDDPFQSPVADDVGVGKHPVLLPGHEEDRRLYLAGVAEVVVREPVVLGVADLILHRLTRPDHLADVAVVIHGGGAIEVAAAPVGHIREVLVLVEGRPSGSPHHRQHVAGGHVALLMEHGNHPREQLAAGESRILAPARIQVGEPEHVVDHRRGEGQFQA
jgi:hypothetical protein